MGPRLRVFVTTSHISCLYMSLHAEATKQEGDTDVLLIDIGARRKEVINAIRQAASLHSWALMESFSDELGAEHRFEPSLRKRLTRQWKELPVLRTIYAQLLSIFERKRDRRLRERLGTLLVAYDGHDTVEIFGHTQTRINQLLPTLYPSSRSFIFEHGLGDYLYATERGRMERPMFALFAHGFKRFLERRGMATDMVHTLALPSDFPRIALEQLRSLSPSVPDDHSSSDRPIVFILLEAVDMYEVPPTFWAAYIDHILSHLNAPARYHFILKPHPIASTTSLHLTEQHFRDLGLQYTMLNSPLYKGIAAEVTFSHWADRCEHVFCLFSSACFYLSELYRDPRITFHYSTDFMDKWTSDAPPMYKRHFEGLKPLIIEVFSERCQPY